MSASIKSRHVAMIYGVEEHDGRIGILMELVRGRTLREIVLDQGPLGAGEAALVGIDLCRALAAVHAKGILHRDIKAQNVMRESGGRNVLMDFGIGQKAADALESRSTSGTPLYLAPEVFEGNPASVQSDLYSLGVLLFYLACGEFPISGSSISEIRAAHQSGRRRSLFDLCPDLPPAFVRLVERAIDARPEARFRSAGELEEELQRVLVPANGSSGTRSRTGTTVGRWKIPALVVASLLCACWVGLRLYPDDAAARALVAFAEEARWEGNMRVAVRFATVALNIEPDDLRALMTLEICSREMKLS